MRMLVAGVVAILLAGGALIVWKNPSTFQTLTQVATTTGVRVGQLSQKESFEKSPLYKIVTSPLSEKYVNAEMRFSLMLPEKVIVTRGDTYWNGENPFKIIINETGYESSMTDLWGFYPEDENPARNPVATSLEDYMKNYPAPGVKDHVVIIHNNERVNSTLVRQEYSYGFWYPGANNEIQFFPGTLGCDACYFAFHYVRYVYYNSKTGQFVILERSPLTGESYENSIAYREKELLTERIARTISSE